MKKSFIFSFLLSLLILSNSSASALTDCSSIKNKIDYDNAQIDSVNLKLLPVIQDYTNKVNSSMQNGGSSIDASLARDANLLRATINTYQSQINNFKYEIAGFKNDYNSCLYDLNTAINVSNYLDNQKTKATTTEQAPQKSSNTDPWIIEGGYIRGSDLFCDTGYNKDTVNFKCVKDQTVASCSQGTDYLGRKITDSQGNPSMSCHCSSGYKWVGGTKCQKYNIETGELTEDKPAVTTNTVIVNPTINKAVAVSQPVIPTTYSKPVFSNTSKGKNTVITEQKNITPEPSVVSTTTLPIVIQPKVIEEKMVQPTTIFGKIKSVFRKWFQ